jgi:hypothetical protein
MEPFVQPRLKAAGIVIQRLCFGNAAVVEAIRGRQGFNETGMLGDG